MDLRDLECFLAVAEQRHFGRAAESIYMAQPTVSKAVQRLERHLGGVLFNRRTHPVSLTPLGEAFFDRASSAYQQMLAAYQEARRYAHGEAEWLVACTPDLEPTLLEAAVPVLPERLPGLDLTWRTIAMPTQAELVRRGDVDLGVAWCPPEDETLQHRVLGHARYLVAVRSDSRIAQCDELEMDDLAGHQVYLWPREGQDAMHETLSSLLIGHGVRIGESGGSTYAAVLGGDGVAVVPPGAPVPSSRCSVSYIPLIVPTDPWIGLYWRNGDSRPELRELIRLIVDLAFTQAWVPATTWTGYSTQQRQLASA